MLKKQLFLSIILTVVISAGTMAADCSITGNWTFDMQGVAATVTYTSDGKLSQDMFGMKIEGTYTVKGNKLTTVVSGQKTVFTILDCKPETILVKRDKDGLTVIYKKK